MKNADMPAMPVVTSKRVGDVEMSTSEATGLTKREMMAMHIFSGLLSGPAWTGYVEDAVRLADDLLEELDRTSK